MCSRGSVNWTWQLLTCGRHNNRTLASPLIVDALEEARVRAESYGFVLYPSVGCTEGWLRKDSDAKEPVHAAIWWRLARRKPDLQGNFSTH
jgi:hypothetical protein